MAKKALKAKTRVKKLRPIKTAKAVLKLRLGRCRTAHTKRMLKDLDDAAYYCVQARNAALQAWMRWSWDNPDWQPEAVVKKDGTALTRRGVPVCKNMPLPKTLDIPGHGEKSGRMLLYYAALGASPNLAATLISICAREVEGRLKTKTPWNHNGQANYVWEAVRRYEIAPSSFTAVEIPIPNQDAALCYEGECSNVGNPPKGTKLEDLKPDQKMVMARKQFETIRGRIHRDGRSGDGDCVLRFPLFSMKSGRRVTDVIVNLESRQLEKRKGNRTAKPLSDGYQDILRKIARREYKLSDSKLVKKEGVWYAHLSYERPQTKLGLPRDRVAVLETLRDKAYYPFSLSHGRALWKLGDVPTFKAENHRLREKRRMLSVCYKDSAASGVKGHGRRRYYERILPRTKKIAHHTNQFINRMVAEVVKFCTQHAHCGTVHYREPSKNLREVGWFATNDLPMDWTGFLSKLHNALHLYDINLIVEVESCKEWRERCRLPAVG